LVPFNYILQNLILRLSYYTAFSSFLRAIFFIVGMEIEQYKESFEPGIDVQAYNPNAQEVEEGGYQVGGQPGQHSQTVSK
jgi:hypothetical protein